MEIKRPANHPDDDHLFSLTIADLTIIAIVDPDWAARFFERYLNETNYEDNLVLCFDITRKSLAALVDIKRNSDVEACSEYS